MPRINPNFRARVSKDEGASCFETHRSALVLAQSYWQASAAMLHSMRQSVAFARAPEAIVYCASSVILPSLARPCA